MGCAQSATPLAVRYEPDVSDATEGAAEGSVTTSSARSGVAFGDVDVHQRLGSESAGPGL